MEHTLDVIFNFVAFVSALVLSGFLIAVGIVDFFVWTLK